MLAPDTTLSAECREVLHDLIWSIPQNELLTYAATGAALMGGGFRKNNLAVVRARVMQVAEGKEQIDDNLRKLLVRHDLCASCLAVLSEEIIRENLEYLAALFGAPRLSLALQLDPRLADSSAVDSNRWPSTAIDGNRNSKDLSCVQPDPEEKKTAPSALREALAPLLAVLGADGTETPRNYASPTALKEARKEIASLKGAAERLEKEMVNREKAEAEAKKWRGKAEAAEKAIGPLRQRAEKAEADLARHIREAEAMADAKLETRLAAEFAEWLGGRRAAMLREVGPAGAGEVAPLTRRSWAADAARLGRLRGEVSGGVAAATSGGDSRQQLRAAPAASNFGQRQLPATSGSASCQQPQAASAAGNFRQQLGPTVELLARAAAAIAKQTQADLAAGTRSALEDKLAAYEETLARCTGLITDALHPTEELLAVEKELAAEVRRIRQLLHPDTESTPSTSPEEALVRAVNTAADHELPDLQHTTNRLFDLKIVTDEAKERIDERIRNRYAALYAKRGGPGLETGDGANAEHVLQCALKGKIALVFLVDGHNALYALQSRYSRPQDHRGPSSEARDWLVNDIVQVFANAHNCRVLIVFDGPERTESNPAGNVKVVYSGGGGSDVEHRADDVLVDEARFLREADPNVRMLIATNDNGLSSRAATLGVRNIAPTALLTYLR